MIVPATVEVFWEPANSAVPKITAVYGDREPKESAWTIHDLSCTLIDCRAGGHDRKNIKSLGVLLFMRGLILFFRLCPEAGARRADGTRTADLLDRLQPRRTNSGIRK